MGIGSCLVLAAREEPETCDCSCTSHSVSSVVILFLNGCLQTQS